MRLTKDERVALQDATNAEDTEDPLDTIVSAFRIVIADKDDAEALITAIGDDLGVALEIFNNFTSEVQLGEASSSEN